MPDNINFNLICAVNILALKFVRKRLIATCVQMTPDGMFLLIHETLEKHCWSPLTSVET